MLELETESDPTTLAVRVADALSGGVTSVRQIVDTVPGARGAIIVAAFRALNAVRGYWPKGAEKMSFEPDFRTQLDAAKLLLAYSEGLPAQTTLALNVNAAGRGAEVGEDLEATLERSPALRERLGAMLRAEGAVIPSRRKRLERAERAAVK